MIDSLYIKYGSRLTTGTSELLYDKLLSDEDLKGFFVAINIDKLRDHMADFLGSLTGGPDIYEGRTIQEAHANLPISKAHFLRVAQHLQEALAESGIEEADRNAIMDAVAGLADELINV